jgi:hypothetical protein
MAYYDWNRDFFQQREEHLPSTFYIQPDSKFNRKYGVDAVWAADFIIGGTDSADLIEAFETVEADPDYQAAVLVEFGQTYDVVFEDLCKCFRGKNARKVKAPV